MAEGRGEWVLHSAEVLPFFYGFSRIPVFAGIKEKGVPFGQSIMVIFVHHFLLGRQDFMQLVAGVRTATCGADPRYGGGNTRRIDPGILLLSF